MDLVPIVSGARGASPIVYTVQVPLSPPAESVGPTSTHSGGTLMAVCSSCQSSRLPRRLVSQATSSIGSMRNGQLLLIPSSPQAPSSLGPVHVDQTQTQDPAVDCRWTSMVMRSRAHTVGRWTDTDGAWHSDGYCAHWHSPQSLTLTHCFPQQHWIWFRIAACG